MIFFDEILRGIDIMLHPGSATTKKMSIGDAFSFYYKLTLVPVIISIAIAAVFIIAFYSFVQSSYSFAGIGALGIILLPLASLWIINPIGIFVSAGLYQIFGKLFRQFRNDYTATLNAVVYGTVPTVLFYWAIIIPMLGSLIAAVMGIWGFIVLVIALSRQQKISTAAAFGISILVPIIIGVIVAVIIFVFAFAMFGALMHSGILASNSSLFGINSSGSTATSLPSGIIPSGSSATTPQNPSTTSANYSSCSSFTLSSSSYDTTVKGICTWSGGNLSVYVGGGNSGWEAVTIKGADNKKYLQQSSSAWQLKYYGVLNLPAQNYYITLTTGNGGGAYGNAAVQLSTS